MRCDTSSIRTEKDIASFVKYLLSVIGRMSLGGGEVLAQDHGDMSSSSYGFECNSHSFMFHYRLPLSNSVI